MSSRDFDVAVSYASEQRQYVERFVKKLRENGLNVYYDRDAQIYMVGKILDQELHDIYLNRSSHCVLFLSKEYINKPITRYESQIILSETLFCKGFMYIFKFDDVTIPGLNRNFIYSSINDFQKPESYADFMFEVIRGKKPQSLKEDYLFTELGDQLLDVMQHIASYMGYAVQIDKQISVLRIRLSSKDTVVLHVQIKKALGRNGIQIWSHKGLYPFEEHAYQGYLEWVAEECNYQLSNNGLLSDLMPLISFPSLGELCERIKAEYIRIIG